MEPAQNGTWLSDHDATGPLAHRVAVVTGASRGIGAATAMALAAAGARVALVARSGPALSSIAGRIFARGGVAASFPADLSDPDAVDDVARRIGDRMGPPDILVNNAGSGRWLSVEETPADEAVEMVRMPYLAAFLMTKALLPAMLDRRAGHIVNVSSALAYVPVPGATGYTAARWAMRGFSEALRQDVAGTGIGISLLVAGKVATAYFEHNPGTAERIPWASRVLPTLSPEQVGAAILDAIVRRRDVVFVPRGLGFFCSPVRPIPALSAWLLRSTGWRRPSRRNAP